MRQHLPASSPLSRDSERAGAGIAPARPVLAGWRESCAARSAHSPPCLYRVIAEGEGDDGEPEQTSPLEVILIASCRPHRCSTLLGKRRRAPLRVEMEAGPRRALLPFTLSGGGRRFFRFQNPGSETCWTVGCPAGHHLARDTPSECHFPGFKIKVLETGGGLRTSLIITTSLIVELQLGCALRNNAFPLH